MGYKNISQKQAREAKVRDAVEGWRASGLTQEEYCEERGLKLTTFKSWSREYRAKERELEQSRGETDASAQAGKSETPESTCSHNKEGAEETEEKPSGAKETEGPRVEDAPPGELIVVDVVDRLEGRGNREKPSRLNGLGERTQTMRLAPERGRNEPVEIELPSGIVIRLAPGTEAWRVAGIVREIQNTC